MSDEIVKFNPNDLAEQLRAKIRVELADLMPKEVWDKLLSTEIDKFLNDQKPNVSYQGRAKIPSGLSQVVQEELGTMMREKIRDLLKTQEWAGYWDSQNQVIGTKVEELIIKNAPNIIQKLLENAIQEVIKNLQYTA